MNPDQFAILMLVPFFATGILIAHWGGLPTKKDILLRILILVGAASVAAFCFPIYADDPVPNTAASFGIFCAPLTAFFVRSLKISSFATVAICLLVSSNTALFVGIQSRPGMTRGSLSHYEKKNSRILEVIARDLEQHPDGRSYPPSYVDQLDVKTVKDKQDLWDVPREYRYRQLWHAPITGLNEIDSRPARIWFKGGRLDQGASAFTIVGSGSFKPGLWPKPEVPWDR